MLFSAVFFFNKQQWRHLILLLSCENSYRGTEETYNWRMGRHGRGNKRRLPAAQRWYAVWGPHRGVYQGWHVAQPLGQGNPASGVCEVPSFAEGLTYLATREPQTTRTPPGAPKPAHQSDRLATTVEGAEEKDEPREETKEETDEDGNQGSTGSNCKAHESRPAPTTSARTQTTEAEASCRRQNEAAAQQHSHENAAGTSSSTATHKSSDDPVYRSPSGWFAACSAAAAMHWPTWL